MVASALKNLSGWENDILFSSGVSNSGEQNEINFHREIELVKLYLEKITNPASFVYFSTTSIFDPLKKHSSYILHKLKIEKLIKASERNFLIIRLPNLVGFSSNPNTLTNFFADSIRLERKIQLNRSAIRHLIDVADLSLILNDLKDIYGNKKITVNVETDKPLSADLILNLLEEILLKKAFVQPISESAELKGYENDLNISSIKYIWKTKEDYHKNLLKKYYSI